MDIQGASALSALYAPIGAVDGAFVFDDSEHMYRFFTSPASDALKQGFFDQTGVRILGAWNTGARQFTADKPIRTPADLQGLKMRFPPSPQFLMNAAAMGASPVEVAYDELYLALQQGIADGQENPLVNIKAINLARGPGLRQPLEPPAQLEPGRDRQGLGRRSAPSSRRRSQAAVEKAMVEEPKCVVDAEKAILDEFKAGGTMQVDRGRRSRGVPRQGGAVPPGELHARAGRGPRRHPVDRQVDRPWMAGARHRSGTGRCTWAAVRRYPSRP